MTQNSNTGAKPWLNRKDWQTNTLRSKAKSKALFMSLFGIVWCLICLPVLFAIGDEWKSGNYVILFVLIFPLIGLFLLYKGVKIGRAYRHYGIIECVLDPFPGSIGGNVGGTFTINNLQHTKSLFHIELECVYSYTSGSGKNRSRKEKIIWAEAGEINPQRQSNGYQIEFRFDVPEDLPPADEEQIGDYTFWRLTLKNDHLKIPLLRHYDIPVFPTSETSKNIDQDISEQVREHREDKADKSEMAIKRGDFDAAGLEGVVRVKKIDRGLLLTYPMFRNKLLTILALVFGVSFSGASIVILSGIDKFDLFSTLTLFFAIPFGLVGLFGMIAAIYLPLNNLRVTIAAGKLTVLRRLLIIPLYYKQVKARDITKCTITLSGSSGQGTRRKEFYKVKAHLKNTGKICIAEGVEGKDLAEQLREYLCNRARMGY